ncbi:MAG: hypothetical protein IKK10_02935 [Clostridia bacterium]|nr:hypothetical protein [Clostridia bacterium]
MTEIKCVDVSEWQGKVDFSKVKASGTDCVILRAGFGREASQVDAEFERNYKNAKAEGFKVGVYWYSYAVDVVDARKEAEACIEVLKGKSFELPVFYDMEDSSQISLGKSVLTNMAKAFMDKLIKEGFRAGVYANANWFENYLDYKTLYGNYFVWLAQYNVEPEFKCDIWQYSSSGTVNGISGNVDMNIIYNEKLLALNVSDNIQVRDKLKKGDKGIDVLCLKYMLQVASDIGVGNFDMTAGNASFGEGTEKAVKDWQKILIFNQTGVVDKDFVNKLYAKIKESYAETGDVNADGKVNVRDVTALQKQIAGITNV